MREISYTEPAVRDVRKVLKPAKLASGLDVRCRFFALQRQDRRYTASIAAGLTTRAGDARVRTALNPPR